MWGGVGSAYSDEYNVIVHVAEIQHLIWPAPTSGSSKPTARGALPNPRVEVIAGGSSQMTQTQTSTASCTYNKTFRFPNLSLGDMTEGVVEVRVAHVKAYFFQDVIGQWSCTFESIYNKKGHCVVRTWLPLTTPERPTEPRGYIKLSIWVLRPGDAFIPEPENVSATITTGLDGVELDFEKYYLNVNVHAGQDILHPSMAVADTANEDRLPDTCVTVTFLGTSLTTSTCGATRTPTWNESIKIPARVPCMEDKVRVDLSALVGGRKEIIGSHSLSFQSLLKNKLRPTWINFYRYKECQQTVMSIFDTEEDSCLDGVEYVGRILISAVCHKHKAPTPIVTTCEQVQLPAVDDMVMWIDLYEISGLEDNSSSVRIDLSVGLWQMSVSPSFHLAGSFGFDEVAGRLVPSALRVPAAEMCQDLLVRTYVLTERRGWKCAAFLRIPATEILNTGGAPHWRRLIALDDQKMETVADPTLHVGGHSGPAIELLASFSLRPIASVTKLRVQRPARLTYVLRQWHCRAYIFQAVNLPTLPGQLPEAYAIVRMGGGTVFTEAIADNANPDWHEVLMFGATLPEDLTLAHPLTIGVVHQDVLLGSVTLPARYLVQMSADRPEWFALESNLFPDSQARIFCSFDVQPAPPPSPSGELYLPTPEFSPQYKPCDVCIALLGVRFFPGSKRFVHPFVQLEFGRDPSNPEQRLWVRQASAVSGGDGMFNFLRRFDLKCHLPESHLFQSFIECRVCDNGNGYSDDPVEVGVGYLPLSPFLPWVDPAVRKRVRREFRFLPQKMRDMFKPVRRPYFLSPFYMSESALQDETFSRRASVTSESFVDEDLVQATNVDLPEATGEVGAEVNVLGGVPESYAAVQKAVGGRKGSDTASTVGSLSWLDTERVEEEEEGKEELRHTMEQELDLDELPYYHVPIIDPGCHGGQDEVVGYLKIAVRIYEPSDTNRDDPQLAIVERHMSITQCLKVRVNTISAQGLVPRHTFGAFAMAGLGPSGTGDQPTWFLSVSNGVEGQKQSGITDEQNIVEGYSPEFYRSFELDAVLPWNALQEITIVNVGSGSGGLLAFAGIVDKHVYARTLIDIEDRIYHPAYASLTDHGVNVPVEVRAVRDISSAAPLGTLKGWLEILTAEESGNRPMVPLTLPRVETVQIRMVAWRVRGVPLEKDESASLYIRAATTGEEGDTEIQETDTHWNSSDGTAVFNWRFVFDMTVPCQSPGVKVQVWNRNVLTSHDIIAECFLDLSSDMSKAAKTRNTVGLPRMWYKLTHPSQPSKVKGGMEAQVDILPIADATAQPVGSGREEPNRDPYLPEVTESREFFKASALGQGWFNVQSRVKSITTVCFLLVALFVLFSIISFFKWFI